MKFGASSSITSPDESDILLSEEDSTDENYIEFDISRIGRKLNYAEAEASQHNATFEVWMDTVSPIFYLAIL